MAKGTGQEITYKFMLSLVFFELYAPVLDKVAKFGNAAGLFVNNLCWYAGREIAANQTQAQLLGTFLISTCLLKYYLITDFVNNLFCGGKSD